jgi:ribosome hibernation promoting factor
MSQNIVIQGHGMEVTDRLKEYLTKKVAKLDRHTSMIDELQVELMYVKSARSALDRYVTQITIRGKGFALRSEERADDIRTSTDAAVEKLQRQLERYKGKHFHGRGDGKTAAEVAPEPVPAEGEAEAVITRRKTFDLVPMDEAEAVEQMHMLGHDNFFIFINAKTEKINVLYKRNDGTYGVIDPRVR